MVSAPSYNGYRLQGLTPGQALQQSLTEWKAIRHLSDMEIVEPGTEILIRKLQTQLATYEWVLFEFFSSKSSHPRL